MKINVVIVDDNVDRGQKAGRVMSRAMREQMGVTDWEMSVHVRCTDTLTADDAFATYRSG